MGRSNPTLILRCAGDARVLVMPGESAELRHGDRFSVVATRSDQAVLVDLSPEGPPSGPLRNANSSGAEALEEAVQDGVTGAARAAAEDTEPEDTSVPLEEGGEASGGDDVRSEADVSSSEAEPQQGDNGADPDTKPARKRAVIHDGVGNGKPAPCRPVMLLLVGPPGSGEAATQVVLPGLSVQRSACFVQHAKTACTQLGGSRAILHALHVAPVLHPPLMHGTFSQPCMPSVCEAGVPPAPTVRESHACTFICLPHDASRE